MLSINAVAAGLPVLYFSFILLALIVSSVGFYRLVYFVSVGYGLSVAAMGIASLVLFREVLTVLSLLHAVVLTVYGLRLGGYLLYRDFQTSYRNEEEEVKRGEGKRGIGIMFLIWISCSLLYSTMFSPALYHLISGSAQRGRPSVTVAGIVISLGGFVLEALADWQKSRAKKTSPRRFVSAGLYGVVRQPNYFGEILLWTGSFLAAVPFYDTFARWSTAVLGYACIILIMLGSAKRLELKQDKRYGTEEDFREYAAKTPLLFPFVPLYSLKNWKLVLG